MPQLDQFTYFSQFFWLCIFFFSYYVLVLNNALPKISRILKLRKAVCSGSSNSSQLGLNDLQKVTPQELRSSSLNIDDTTKALLDCMSKSRNFMYNSSKLASDWLKSQLFAVNFSQWQALNKTYVRFAGQISMWQILSVSLTNTHTHQDPLMRRYTLKLVDAVCNTSTKKRSSSTSSKASEKTSSTKAPVIKKSEQRKDSGKATVNTGSARSADLSASTTRTDTNNGQKTNKTSVSSSKQGTEITTKRSKASKQKGTK